MKLHDFILPEKIKFDKDKVTAILQKAFPSLELVFEEHLGESGMF